jgi:hypothetical protein
VALKEYLLCHLCQPSLHSHGGCDGCIVSLRQLYGFWTNRYIKLQPIFKDGSKPYDQGISSILQGGHQDYPLTIL